MIRIFSRLAALFDRYQAAILAMQPIARPILDQQNQTVGRIDLIQLREGRFHVIGWAQAAQVQLDLGPAKTVMTPSLSRPDIVAALGIPATVGFHLSLVVTREDFAGTSQPQLTVRRETGQSPVVPIKLHLGPSPVTRVRFFFRFLRDMGLALPAIFGWFVTRNPSFRSKVKARLGLSTEGPTGPLKPGLFPDTETPVANIIVPQAVTIVLPVYNAFDLLRDCLDRIERHTDLPWSLIVIEDASPDQRIAPFLRDWARTRDNVALLENQQNLGFVGSVNRGFEQVLAQESTETTGPVILLNSDALVPEGWASRLVRPFHTHEHVASVTPMSNDAEILSVPQICTRTDLSEGQAEAIDLVARRFAPEAFVSDMPTGVGFCMAIARDWLARNPRLDTAFGRGYGEEVDWCQKVAEQGGRHLGLPGLFVEHRGGESFGSAEKQALVAQNNRIISARYPTYDRRVQDFIAADPLRTARIALALAWAGSCAPRTHVPVYLAHSLGGGADLWLEQRMQEDMARDLPSVVLRVGGVIRFQIEVITPQGRSLGHTDAVEVITALLGILPKRRIVYSCGVGDRDPMALPGVLGALLQDGDAAEMLFHDYFPLSPSVTMLDHDGRYRGPVIPPRDDPAHTTRRPDGTRVSLSDWQNAWKAFAKQAKLVVFSDDSAAHVRAVWPELAAQLEILPHQLRYPPQRAPQPAHSAPVVLAALGNIGHHKGAEVLQAVAKRLSLSADKSARCVLIGTIEPAYALPRSLMVHGSYEAEDLPQLAARYEITHWLIPSVWPETFCYTVHEALGTGLPVMAFGLGAQGDAVARAQNGLVLPFDTDSDLAQCVLEALDHHRSEPEKESTA